ncbi:MAG TPA: HEAT repeat domain-containing protein, partial [Pirellula sp.]|nr:HEAT repeat domain-containing protein [Pirellula sp.]
TSLPGTGGIVRPGLQREMILDEMRVRETDSPEAFLDDPSTALVKLRTIAHPCNSKGDILDVQVESSSECTATSLVEGYILESRLSEMAMLKGKMRTSEPKATANGEVVILPTSFTRQSEITPLKGVVIGGAKLKKDQPIGLRIEEEFRHVIVAKAIETAINTRYFFKDSNKQKMVAEGISNWFVSISTVPKYRHDSAHFMSVIKCTGFGESMEEQQERLLGCKKLLSNPETSRRAAAELEAIGTDAAKEILIGGLSSSDVEIRFYSAYSLAYMDCKESVPVLLELAQSIPAARELCLVGLVVSEDSSAREALEQLLQEPDPDLRFGAFKAIRLRNPTDISVKGEFLGNNFQFVQIPSSIPLLAVSLQKQKEVILFGNSIGVTLTEPVSPTPLLTLTPLLGDQIKLRKRHGNGEIRYAVVANDIVSVLRGLGNIQANYNDVVHTVNQMSLDQTLSTPVAMNPLHNQDMQIVDAANQNSKAFSGAKEVSVDNTSVDHSSSKKSSWWSTIGLRKASLKRAAKDEKTVSNDKALPANPEMSDEELSEMLNR